MGSGPGPAVPNDLHAATTQHAQWHVTPSLLEASCLREQCRVIPCHLTVPAGREESRDARSRLRVRYKYQPEQSKWPSPTCQQREPGRTFPKQCSGRSLEGMWGPLSLHCPLDTLPTTLIFSVGKGASSILDVFVGPVHRDTTLNEAEQRCSTRRRQCWVLEVWKLILVGGSEIEATEVGCSPSSGVSIP